jgi:hypothetical protein
LDEQGWEAVADLLKETLDRVLGLQADAAARLQGADTDEIRSSKVVLMHYEVAPVTAEAKAKPKAKAKARARAN